MGRVIALSLILTAAGCADRTVLNPAAEIEIHIVTGDRFRVEHPGCIGRGSYRPGRITLAPGVDQALLATLLLHEFCHALDDHRNCDHWRVLEAFRARGFDPLTHGRQP